MGDLSKARDLQVMGFFLVKRIVAFFFCFVNDE